MNKKRAKRYGAFAYAINENHVEVMRIMGASEGYGKNSGFALVVVLFILLIIIGATCVY
jgi:uncharacterized protein (TIGR01732 family)